MPSIMMAVSPKTLKKKLVILGVETVDVVVDQGLDFSRGLVRHDHPPVAR